MLQVGCQPNIRTANTPSATVGCGLPWIEMGVQWMFIFFWISCWVTILHSLWLSENFNRFWWHLLTCSKLSKLFVWFTICPGPGPELPASRLLRGGPVCSRSWGCPDVPWCSTPCWAGYRRAGEVEAAVELLQLEPLARIEVIHILGKARNVIIFFPIPGFILDVVITKSNGQSCCQNWNSCKSRWWQPPFWRFRVCT